MREIIWSSLIVALVTGYSLWPQPGRVETII
jgi:hypothetical protein